jgi:hypothetical protein
MERRARQVGPDLALGAQDIVEGGEHHTIVDFRF